MTHQSPGSHRSPRAYLGVGFGVAALSSGAVLVRLAQAEAHSLAIGTWRLVLATAILAPFALLLRRRELARLTRRDWLGLILSGLLLAVHFAAWITSLALTSVAASTVLVSAYPLFIGLASPWLLRERLPGGMGVALAVGFGGGVVIALGDPDGGGSHQLVGNALAVVGAIASAGYFLIGRRLRARLSLLAYVFPVYGAAALILLGVLGASGVPVIPQRPLTWLWLLLMALGPQILGHSALNWALRYLSATYVTLAALGEPVGSTLLAWIVLGERPTLTVVAGGALVLTGILLASRAERRKATTSLLL